jgi:AcrR family transcriptional regulator
VPRAYRLGQRKASADETRARIIAGARELLLSEGGYRNFTMDAIARHTNVARMTVYYQFQSKTGLFEALADDIAERGKIRENLQAAFACEDAREGVYRLIDAFVHFWLSDGDVLRKLRALSELDSESHATERDAWRIDAIRNMLARVKQQYRLPQAMIRRATDALGMLTTFDSAEALARAGVGEREISARIRALVYQSLDWG